MRYRFTPAIGSDYLINETGVDYSLTTAGTFYIINNLSADGQLGTILSGANGTITIQASGYYNIGYTVSYSISGAASADITGFVYRNSSQTIVTSRGSRSQNSKVTDAATGTVFLNVGDVIDLRVSASTDNVTMKIYTANLRVTKVS